MTEQAKMCCCFDEEPCIRRAYNYQSLIGCITLPCCAAGFLWYCCCVAPKVEKLPEGCKRVKGTERNRMLNQLEGRWNIEVLSGGPSGFDPMFPCDKGEFTHATIEGLPSGTGAKNTFLYQTWKHYPNGLKIPRKKRAGHISVIELWRSEDGRLFADEGGLEIVRFEPDNGLIGFQDAWGKCWNYTWVGALCDNTDCVRDISEGFKCTVCEDFVLCSSCHSEQGHEHLMAFKDFSRQGSSGQTSGPITSQPTPPSFQPEGADDLKTMLGGK